MNIYTPVLFYFGPPFFFGLLYLSLQLPKYFMEYTWFLSFWPSHCYFLLGFNFLSRDRYRYLDRNMHTILVSSARTFPLMLFFAILEVIRYITTPDIYAYTTARTIVNLLENGIGIPLVFYSAYHQGLIVSPYILHFTLITVSFQFMRQAPMLKMRTIDG